MVDRSPGFFDLDDRLAELSAKGDGLERVQALVDFEMFRPGLEAAVARADRSKGGRPAFDRVLMFKVLILQAMHALLDERTEFLIKDRLSFIRFLGLRLADAVPDANTIWTFREALKKADAIDGLFRRFDEALRSEGFLAMSGQIVDATIVATPKQRNTLEEKKAIKEGQIALAASEPVWPIALANGVICINMIHISPWEATLGLLRGAAAILPTTVRTYEGGS